MISPIHEKLLASTEQDILSQLSTIGAGNGSAAPLAQRIHYPWRWCCMREDRGGFGGGLALVRATAFITSHHSGSQPDQRCVA